MANGDQVDQPAAILVVDDDLLVAFAIEDIVAQAGYRVIGPATNISDAFRLTQYAHPTAALIDARLGDRDTSNLARELEARSIPFAFVATYSEKSVLRGFRNVPFLPKPFQDGVLLGLVKLLVNRAPGASVLYRPRP